MVCERCGVDVDAGACECEVLAARRTVCADAGPGCEIGCDGAGCEVVFVGAVGGAHER